MCVASSIDRLGFNEDCFLYAEHYQQNGFQSLKNSLDGGERLAGTLASPCLLLISEVDALFNGLAKAKVPTTSLEIGNGLLDQVPHHINDLEFRASAGSWQSIAATLTLLSISAEDEHMEEDIDLWRIVLRAAVNLESLGVHPERVSGENWWHTAQEHGTVVGAILAQNTFQHLRSFEIIGKLDQPTKVRATLLDAFIARHANTLRHVELSLSTGTSQAQP